MHHNKALIAVIDGSRARFFDRIVPLGKMREISTLENDLLKELPSSIHDYPGRVFESANSARHAYENKITWHHKQEEEFIRFLMNYFQEKSDAYQEIIICAPGKILGMLRNHMPKEVGCKITKEYTKDFVKTALEEIQNFLDQKAH